MASPYRDSAYKPRIVVTRSVRGLGWPVALMGALLFLFAYLNFEQRNDAVRLDCPPAAEACVVTKVAGETVAVPEYSDAVVSMSETAIGETFSVQLGAYTNVPVRTRENAERFVAAFKQHHAIPNESHEVFRVGNAPTSALPLAGLGLLFFVVLAVWRGAYRFVRDDRVGVIRVERARGFVPRSVVELPLGDVEEIVAVADRLDTAVYARYAVLFNKTFERYSVVFRTSTGDDVAAFAIRLNGRDALAIAKAASALLVDEQLA